MPHPWSVFFFPSFPSAYHSIHSLPIHSLPIHPLPIHPSPSQSQARLHAHTAVPASLPRQHSLLPPAPPSPAPSGAFRVALRRGLAWHSAKAIASGRVRCQSLPARGHQRVVLHAARFQTTALILDLSLGSQSKSYCPTPGQSFFFPRLPVRLPFHPTILHPLPIHPFSIHPLPIHPPSQSQARSSCAHTLLPSSRHCCPPPDTTVSSPQHPLACSQWRVPCCPASWTRLAQCQSHRIRPGPLPTLACSGAPGVVLHAARNQTTPPLATRCPLILAQINCPPPDWSLYTHIIYNRPSPPLSSPVQSIPTL